MRKLTMDFFGDTAKRLNKVRRKFVDQVFSFNLRCCHGQLASLPVASSRPLISLTAKRTKLQATTPLPIETRKVAGGNTLILGPKNGHQSYIAPYSTGNRSKHLFVVIQPLPDIEVLFSIILTRTRGIESDQ